MTDHPDILAIDVASTTGWARGCVGDMEPLFGTVKFAPKGLPGNSNAIFAAAQGWMSGIMTNPPDIVIVEALLPPDAMKNKTSRQVRDRLAGLHGIIRAGAFRAGVGEISEASVGDVRAHFLGTRILKRLDAKRGVVQRCHDLDWYVTNDNEGDACALWSFAAGLIDPQQGLRVSPLFNRKLRIKTG